MKMNKFEVGTVLDEFKNHEEECIFDITDNGAVMYIFFDSPTADEIQQFKSGHRFEIRFTHLYNSIVVLAKIGNLNWMEMPYNPNLSKDFTTLQKAEDGQGLSLSIVFVDGRTGTIKAMRLLGLSTRFTKSLFKAVQIESNNGFDVAQYNNNVNLIFARYSAKDLLSMSSDYCKINF
ncbi:hypothetical protein LI177_05170 [bacterium 210820-DFI.6.37]|nr:hypothetical protein [bacterium 210820-DFI.6.37]